MAKRPSESPEVAEPAPAAPVVEEATAPRVLTAELLDRPPGPPQAPVISVTRYEQVSTFLLATFLAVGLVVFWMTAVYVGNRPKAPESVAPLELIELPGGVEDGSITETLRVDSPEPERADASIVDAQTSEPSQVEETLENVIELSETAAAQTQEQFLLDPTSTGRKGSATGTGRRALGQGPGKSGIPREQRWFISFSDRGTLDEYARQLDFFGIELGAVFPDGRIVYLTQLSSPSPKTRTVDTGKGENRLYMNWQGGTRRAADQQLFQKANIDAANALVLHFYPPPTEATLARLERDYANRPADQIRRTYFFVQRVGQGYEFEVTRQSYFAGP